MKTWFGLAKTAAALAAIALAASASAQAQSMRTVDGQAYWRGDPGPIDPGSFWSGGEYKYDPHHYMGFSGREGSGYTDVVYAEHTGQERCVWRKRVVNSNSEHMHPYLKVCRP